MQNNVYIRNENQTRIYAFLHDFNERRLKLFVRKNKKISAFY